jgi:hypothetical protein
MSRFKVNKDSTAEYFFAAFRDLAHSQDFKFALSTILGLTRPFGDATLSAITLLIMKEVPNRYTDGVDTLGYLGGKRARSFLRAAAISHKDGKEGWVTVNALNHLQSRRRGYFVSNSPPR